MTAATSGADIQPVRGTARDALANPNYRRLFFGSALSNTGRWLQTAALGVLAYEISGSSAYLGTVIFFQLIPMSMLSLLGGSLADTANRRTLLLVTQAWQMFWTAVLAVTVIDGTISKNMLLLLVFVIGLGQGLYAPALNSVLPTIAGENNLSAAIALNSMQTNATRVIGPALGGLVVTTLGYAAGFGLNAASYVFVLGAIWLTEIPKADAKSRSFVDRIFGGFRVAFRAPQVGRPLLLMTLFTLFCLPFIGQLPAIAEVNLGIASKSTEYGWFYACFGLGAVIGAGLVGTIFLGARASRLAPVSLVGFAVSLAWLTSISDIGVGYVAIFSTGLFYFMLPTTLATAWQEHVDTTVRGRVAALWTLAFGGTIPFANLIAGRVIEATTLSTVLYAGAVAALVLAAVVRLPRGAVVDEGILQSDLA